jgi:hypothetical protein
MHKNEVKVLAVGRSKFYGMGESGLMALLLVLGVIQIAYAVSASGDMVNAKDAAVAREQQMHNTTLLAKK